MWGIMDQEKQYSSARKRNTKSKSDNIVTLSDSFAKKQYGMMLRKNKHDDLKDELRN